MKKLFILGICIIVLQGFSTRAEKSVGWPDEAKPLADLQRPAPYTNNVGGTFRILSPDKEGSQVRWAIDEIEKRGDGGGCLRLEYDVSGKEAHNGFSMKLGSAGVGGQMDASGYSKLCLWIKGDSKAGIPSRIKLEVRGETGNVATKYIANLNSEWAKVELPLKEVATQGVDLMKLRELCIVFEQTQAQPATVGTVYVDDITVE